MAANNWGNREQRQCRLRLLEHCDSEFDSRSKKRFMSSFSCFVSLSFVRGGSCDRQVLHQKTPNNG
jgi:hypothetical protein